MMIAAVAGAALLLGGLLYVILRAPSRADQDAWAAALAKRVGGEFTPVVDADNPWIRFQVEGRPAEFWFGSRPDVDGRVATVEVDVLGLSRGALKVARGSPSSLSKFLFRIQDLEVGDAAFDRAFVVQANPPELAREIFSIAERARLIWHLRRLSTVAPPILELSQDTLELGFARRPEDPDVLMHAVEAAAAFVQRLASARPSAGIDWGTSGAGRCPVCASLIEGPVVSCELCRTVHHEECWRWTGRCARYACRATRARA